MKRGKIISLITGVFLVCGVASNAATDPPPPSSDSTTQNPPCSSSDEETGTGVPPPPGLCLPINDYLAPLFLAGMVLGSVKLVAVKKRREETH
ncbi:hypothetical protein [Salinimicrobium soli]|uniref:hypothetical protein n=1 Tax=Salinimicrobium soli TaxID=1254399 RepID=UPI003AAD08D3